MLHHFVHLHLERPFHKLGLELLLSCNLLLDLALELLLGKKAYSLVHPDESLETVLVVAHHVVLLVFFDRQFLAQSNVDLVDRLLETGQHILHAALNRWHDLLAHGISELLHHELLDGLFRELLSL